MAGEDAAAIQYYKSSITQRYSTQDKVQNRTQICRTIYWPSRWKSLSKCTVLLFWTEWLLNRWDQTGQQQAPYIQPTASDLLVHTNSWNVSIVAEAHVTPVPFIYSELWVSCKTTCKSEGGVRPYHHYKKSCMLTRTRQAHYVQTMQHCLQSCALFHSLHPTPSGLADLPSCSKIIC